MDTAGYRALRAGSLNVEQAQELLPDRNTLGMVWRFLAAVPGGQLRESPECLCRKLVRWSGMPMNLGKLMVCLDIFADVDLIRFRWNHKNLSLCLMPTQEKADLNQSATMQRLSAVKES